MKIYTTKTFLAGLILILIVCISFYISLINKSAPKNNNSPQIAQVDIAAFNGGVIIYEVPLLSKVKKGQVILKLNSEKYKAQMEVDKARMMNDLQKYQRDLIIDQQNHNGTISAQNLASAKFTVVEDYQTIKIDKQYVKECTLKAPFDGTVTKIVNYTGSGVGNGNEIMDITAIS